MKLYRVVGQAHVGLTRVARVISARDDLDVLRLVSPVLTEAGFYVLSIEEV